ncbi:MAG TPA: glycosyltransferase [Bryobacteraceae bacterium]|nr:glycosyltransferase [Bryobacteraceae bacterium]
MIFCRRQAESIAREGVEVSSFHLRSRTDPCKLVREFFRFRREAAAFSPHVIHAHFGTVTALFGALTCGRTPLVITYRGSDLNASPASDGMRARAGRLFSQIAALRATRIVCVSRHLRSRLWWRRARAIVLPSGVDREAFRPEPRSAARARLQWPESEPVVLFNAGRDPQNKRLDLAQAAAASARRRLPDLRLEIMDGSVDPARVPTLMNASDCLLVASDAEGSPTVVQEALACGLPVVSVDVGDVADRLQGIANTRIVPRDAEAIGRALAEIAAVPLRTDGPAKAEEVCLRVISLRLRDLYLEIAGSKP